MSDLNIFSGLAFGKIPDVVSGYALTKVSAINKKTRLINCLSIKFKNKDIYYIKNYVQRINRSFNNAVQK